MAEEYGVDDNPLFISAAKQYEVQRKVIAMIEEGISSGDTIVAKTYVKDQENVSAHPLIKELPKHIDSANKTLKTMLDIISTLGRPREAKDELQDFINGR